MEPVNYPIKEEVEEEVNQLLKSIGMGKEMLARRLSKEGRGRKEMEKAFRESLEDQAWQLKRLEEAFSLVADIQDARQCLKPILDEKRVVIERLKKNKTKGTKKKDGRFRTRDQYELQKKALLLYNLLNVRILGRAYRRGNLYLKCAKVMHVFGYLQRNPLLEVLEAENQIKTWIYRGRRSSGVRVDNKISLVEAKWLKGCDKSEIIDAVKCGSLNSNIQQGESWITNDKVFRDWRRVTELGKSYR